MPSPEQQPNSGERREATDDVIIEGGTVEPLNDIEVKTRRLREATAKTIALALVWILGLSAAVHYLAIFVLVLSDKATAIHDLSQFFNAWLPVISGLVGSSITYYFTKER